MAMLKIQDVKCVTKKDNETFDAGDTEMYGFAVKNISKVRLENIEATVSLVDKSRLYNRRAVGSSERGKGAWIVPNDRHFGDLEVGEVSKWREFGIETSDNAPGGEYKIKVDFAFRTVRPDPTEKESLTFKFFDLYESGGTPEGANE